MNRADIEQEILELKHEYARVQGDLEKLESVGRSTEACEKQLRRIEAELNEYQKQLTQK